tara:strand:+ start:743 stop:1237 length:495 start_codon:yes stop_codon:yes gene_type:complete
MRSKYVFGDDWDIDNKWTKLGDSRKCVTHDVCSNQSHQKEVINTLANLFIQQLTTGGYNVKFPKQSVYEKILLCVSDANEPEETLQTPVRIWLSYQKSRVCDEYRVIMEISFVWPGWMGTRPGYSMVNEFDNYEKKWVTTHKQGVYLTPPCIHCHTIFNRIKCV